MGFEIHALRWRPRLWVALDKAAGLRVREWVKVWDSWRIYRDMICTITNFPGEKISFLYSFVDGQETSKRVALLGIIASGFHTGRRFGAFTGHVRVASQLSCALPRSLGSGSIASLFRPMRSRAISRAARRAPWTNTPFHRSSKRGCNEPFMSDGMCARSFCPPRCRMRCWPICCTPLTMPPR